MLRISAAIEPAGGRSETDQLYLLTRDEAEEKSLAVKLGREDVDTADSCRDSSTASGGVEPVGDCETGKG